MATYTANALLLSAQKLASWRGAGYANSEGMFFVRCIPFKGTKSVVYHWRHKPSPLKRNKNGSLPKNAHKPSYYDVYLEFNQVTFADSIDDGQVKADDTWSVIEYKGEKYYFEKPRIDKNPIRVRCSCDDFRFRFEEPCWKAGILYGGTYKRYVRKTPPPPEGRPYANPLGVPGLCKHIYNSLTRSITEGWILGRSL